MSLPPTSSSFPPTAFQPEPLLAVSCPTCFGAIAVGSELLGRPAECPLCGSGFRTPLAAVADPPRREHSSRKKRPAARPEPAASDLAAAPSQDSPSELQPSAKPADELQFEEPVKTVVSGDRVITLRRLTPEEKAARRARRNAVMMIAGVSILMAVVLLFVTKRPKRRS